MGRGCWGASRGTGYADDATPSASTTVCLVGQARAHGHVRIHMSWISAKSVPVHSLISVADSCTRARASPRLASDVDGSMPTSKTKSVLSTRHAALGTQHVSLLPLQVLGQRESISISHTYALRRRRQKFGQSRRRMRRFRLQNSGDVETLSTTFMVTASQTRRLPPHPTPPDIHTLFRNTPPTRPRDTRVYVEVRGNAHRRLSLLLSPSRSLYPAAALPPAAAALSRPAARLLSVRCKTSLNPNKKTQQNSKLKNPNENKKHGTIRLYSRSRFERPTSSGCTTPMRRT